MLSNIQYLKHTPPPKWKASITPLNCLQITFLCTFHTCLICSWNLGSIFILMHRTLYVKKNANVICLSVLYKHPTHQEKRVIFFESIFVYCRLSWLLDCVLAKYIPFPSSPQATRYSNGIDDRCLQERTFTRKIILWVTLGHLSHLEGDGAFLQEFNNSNQPWCNNRSAWTYSSPLWTPTRNNNALHRVIGPPSLSRMWFNPTYN